MKWIVTSLIVFMMVGCSKAPDCISEESIKLAKELYWEGLAKQISDPIPERMKAEIIATSTPDKFGLTFVNIVQEKTEAGYQCKGALKVNYKGDTQFLDYFKMDDNSEFAMFAALGADYPNDGKLSVALTPYVDSVKEFFGRVDQYARTSAVDGGKETDESKLEKEKKLSLLNMMAGANDDEIKKFAMRLQTSPVFPSHLFLSTDTYYVTKGSSLILTGEIKKKHPNLSGEYPVEYSSTIQKVDGSNRHAIEIKFDENAQEIPLWYGALADSFAKGRAKFESIVASNRQLTAKIPGDWGGKYICNATNDSSEEGAGPVSLDVVVKVAESKDKAGWFVASMDQTIEGGGAENLVGQFGIDTLQSWNMTGSGKNASDMSWNSEFAMELKDGKFIGAGKRTSSAQGSSRDCTLELAKK